MLEKLSEGTIANLIKPLIDRVNAILHNLMPNGEIYIVMLASGLIAYYIKNKYNWGKIAFAVTAVIIYGFLRWLGIA